MFKRGWEAGIATIVQRQDTKGIRALRDTQFGGSWMYDYVADIQPASGAPVFRATFTVHFGGRDPLRPGVGEHAPVRFDPRSGKVELDHAALREYKRAADDAARAEFDTVANAPAGSAASRGAHVNTDLAPRPDRLKAAQEAHEATEAHRAAKARKSAEARKSTADASDPVDRLERLAALRDRGVLSDAEFEAQKARILDAS